jgi:D-aminopeptidase
VREPPQQRGPRLRELGLRIGDLEAGPSDSIADVAGVQVGHVTVWRDEPEPPAGRGVARTGVTAIVPGPLDEPVPAGVAVLNGAGELTASHEIREWGLLNTPVYLTSTMAVGRIYDGAVSVALASDPRVGVDDVVIPLVGECDDSHLSDARTVQVEAEDAARAVEAASPWPIAEGAVGAGTGMSCLGWKGGIGTASRVAPKLGCTLGALVLANFGSARQLRVAGVPVGRLLPGEPDPGTPAGSCIVVVATDAPVTAHQLERVARRAGLGLARTGSVAHHGSGEIFLAFSTARQAASVEGGEIDEVFAATVDATEEAVLNALWAAPDVEGREGRVQRGLPHEEVLELLGRHELLGEPGHAR